MKIIEELVQNSPEWIEARRGKITGSKLDGLVVKRGSGRKIGFYEIIAERLGIPADDENAMARGHRLEDEAVAEFETQTGKKVTKVGMCISDFNENIAISPDGLIDNDGKFTEAVEVKCLGSARHIEAIVTNEIPSTYDLQVIQYFIVNEDLQRLFFVFYDPRILSRPYHCITVERSTIEKEIETYKEYQIKTLAEIDEIVSQLEF